MSTQSSETKKRQRVDDDTALTSLTTTDTDPVTDNHGRETKHGTKYVDEEESEEDDAPKVKIISIGSSKSKEKIKVDEKKVQTLICSAHHDSTKSRKILQCDHCNGSYCDICWYTNEIKNGSKCADCGDLVIELNGACRVQSVCFECAASRKEHRDDPKNVNSFQINPISKKCTGAPYSGSTGSCESTLICKNIGCGGIFCIHCMIVCEICRARTPSSIDVPRICPHCTYGCPITSPGCDVQQCLDCLENERDCPKCEDTREG
jgi:hypothetical protein